MPRGATGSRRLQYGMRREEGGEHDDVAEQEYPESISNDDALGGGSPFAAPCGVVVSPAAISCCTTASKPIRIDIAPMPLW